jgi:hypothetical protein
MWYRLMRRSLLFSAGETSAEDAELPPNDAMASSKFGVLLAPDSDAITMVLKNVLSPSVWRARTPLRLVSSAISKV